MLDTTICRGTINSENLSEKCLLNASVQCLIPIWLLKNMQTILNNTKI